MVKRDEDALLEYGGKCGHVKMKQKGANSCI